MKNLAPEDLILEFCTRNNISSDSIDIIRYHREYAISIEDLKLYQKIIDKLGLYHPEQYDEEDIYYIKEYNIYDKNEDKGNSVSENFISLYCRVSKDIKLGDSMRAGYLETMIHLKEGYEKYFDINLNNQVVFNEDIDNLKNMLDTCVLLSISYHLMINDEEVLENMYTSYSIK